MTKRSDEELLGHIIRGLQTLYEQFDGWYQQNRNPRPLIVSPLPPMTESEIAKHKVDLLVSTSIQNVQSGVSSDYTDRKVHMSMLMKAFTQERRLGDVLPNVKKLARELLINAFLRQSAFMLPRALKKLERSEKQVELQEARVLAIYLTAVIALSTEENDIERCFPFDI